MTHLNVFTTILADATTAVPAAGSTAAAGATTGQPQPTGLQLLFGNPIILLIAMVGLMYVFLFRPQSQQRKQQAKLQDSLKSGDRIVTTAGIVGIVVSVKDKTVSIRSADAKIEVTKASIVDVIERADEEKSAS
jgi:preprotein translocase subunit YajC